MKDVDINTENAKINVDIVIYVCSKENCFKMDY